MAGSFPFVRWSYVRQVLDLVDPTIGRGEFWAKGFGLTSEQLAGLDAKIALGTYMRMLKAVAAVHGNPLSCLQNGYHWPHAAIGSLGYLMANQPSILDAWKAAAHYGPIVSSNSVFAVRRTADGYRLTYGLRWPEADDCRPHYLRMLGYAAGLVRHFVGAVVPGARYRVPDSMQPYRQDLRSMPFEVACAGDSVAVDLPASIAHFRPEGIDPVLARIVAEHLTRLRHRKEAPIIQQLVQDELTAQIGRSTPDIDRTAQQLGLSVRTLQRRLEESGVCFADLVEATRRSLAVQHILQSDLSIGEISDQLGYGSISSFSRAFQRWEGQTPSRYREQGVSQPGAPARAWGAADVQMPIIAV